MDKAFQFSEGLPAEFNGVEYRIVVRSMPAWGTGESQVVLLKQKTGPTQVVQYRLREGSRPIIDEYNQVLRRDPKAGIADVLNRVVIEKTQQIGSDKINQLTDEFLRLSIPTKLSTELCMDGTTYEIWAQTPSNWIHASLSNCAYGENTDSQPVFRWINALRTQLQNLATSNPSPRAD
jgi:hypothetical protein